MNRVKTVIVGLNFGGYIIRQLMEGEGREYLELVGLCDLDTEKCRQQAAQWKVQAYQNLDEALADPAVEAIGLFTGPVGRAALIRRIIQSGKHVVTTKPFERDAAAALHILREAEQMQRAVFLNSPSPTLPDDLAQAQKWQTQFDLGRPVAARFDVWAGYHETADGRWYDDPAQCPVAPVFRIGIYLINDAVRLFGEAMEVQVLSSRLRTGRPTPDNAQVGILFHSGVLVNIFASLCVDDGDSHRNAMTLNYERGTIYRNCGPEQSTGREGGSEMALVQRVDGSRTVAAKTTLEKFHPHHVYQWDIFQRYVRGDRSFTQVTPETVAAGIRVIEAMARAEQIGGRALVESVEEKRQDKR